MERRAAARIAGVDTEGAPARYCVFGLCHQVLSLGHTITSYRYHSGPGIKICSSLMLKYFEKGSNLFIIW